jgi:LuxR family maltose regulon positive regulatory protein
VADDLLLTKLFMPGVRPNYISRPAVVARLEAGLAMGRAVSLLAAPAGYGKTAVAVEWLRGSNRPVAWLSLDESDNSLAHFLRYLARALQNLPQPIGSRLQALLNAPKLGTPKPLATALINDIVEAGGELGPFVLALDDLHLVTEAQVFAFLEILLEHAPAQLHVVLVTRRDPPLSLARLRAQGTLTEVRQRDLRFSEAEARQLLEGLLAVPFSEEDVRQLNQSAEGWVAGLQLAALSMQGLDAVERRRVVAGFSGRHRFILDYLTDEVLKRQSLEAERFLLHTSILSRMCGSLCDAVLNAGNDHPERNGQQMLEQLEQANLFLVRLDNERRWYRYHNLFGELLRARLGESDSALMPELHRRAAGWFEAEGHMPTAVSHALRAGDMEQAAGVVERAIMTVQTWSQVEMNELMGWLEALPEDVVARRPWLRLFRSRCLFVMGHTEAARQTLVELAAWLEAHEEAPDSGKILGRVRLDRASYAVVEGDAEEGLAQAELALETMPPDDRIGRLRVLALLALAHIRKGSVRQAEALLSDVAEQAQAVGLPAAAVPLLCNRADAELAQGRLTEAAHTCEQALEMGVVQGHPIAVTGFAWLQLGKIAFERDNLSDAENHLLKAVELLAGAGIGESFGAIHGVLALVRQAQGKPAEALAEAQRAVEIAEEAGIKRMISLAGAFRARIWLAQEQAALVSRWMTEYQTAGSAPYLRAFEEATLVRALLAAGASEQALTMIDNRLPEAEEASRWFDVIELRALRALTGRDQGDAEGALADIRLALDLARPEGMRRLFLDLGAPMAELLKRLSERGHADPFVRELLTRFGAVQEGEPFAVSHQASLVEPLTKRELEVLHGLAAGQTSQEIAARLYLSPNTVRTHIYNLYDKLGAHSRVQALNRARELGLLAD